MLFKEHKLPTGEILYYCGEPDLGKLKELAEGPGDLWHSSLDQGYEGVFWELIYQISVFWWFLNDNKDLDESINWRINPSAFVVRKSVWETLKGFPLGYDSEVMKAFDLGFRLLRYCGGIPMYIRGLYPEETNYVTVSEKDRYSFFLKNFKKEHAWYMLLKKGLKNPIREWNGYRAAISGGIVKNEFPLIPPRQLKEVSGKPQVSVIIPTMFRQNFTLQLLQDYQVQTYPVREVIVVDATPEELRVRPMYDNKNYSFDLKIKWQTTKGSCRARNEAIRMCEGDYIIFADDDTRIPADFVENHIRLLQTYKVEACNGLDIQAGYYEEDLDDLEEHLKVLGNRRWKAGAAQTFSNANSCVRKDWVDRLIGNDINFDGGYGEDSDFGFSLFQKGAIVLFNPFSVNLHLKPPSGGYRHWSLESAILGRKRKKQAWELDHPVRYIRPVPSPTIVYGILKRFKNDQVREYRSKYFFLYLFKGSKTQLVLRLIKLPYKWMQFDKSLFYAENLKKKGVRYQ